MTVIISEIITQGEQSHLKHIASASTEADALAVLQDLLQQQDGKQYQIDTWIDAQPTFLAVAAYPQPIMLVLMLWPVCGRPLANMTTNRPHTMLAKHLPPVVSIMMPLWWCRPILSSTAA